MKKFLKKKLLSFLVRLAEEDMNKIMKVTVGEEAALYRFQHPDDVVMVLRAAQTMQIVHHYHAEGKEKDYAKGAVGVLKLIIEAHKKAIEIDSIKDDEKRLHLWSIFRKNN